MLDGGTAVVGVIANGAGLSASIASGVQKGIAKASSAITASGNKLGGSLGSALSVGATVGFAALAALTVKGISDFQQLGGEVRTLEKQLGTTAEQASVLRAQAEALGVGVDKVSVGFGIFAKHLVAGDDVLAQYGVTVQKTADGQIDFGAQLQQLSTIFNEMDPGLERTAAAMNLFGRSGKTLLPLLAANSDELAKFAANAEAAGLIMSEEDVVAARELSIAQRELGASFKGLEVGLARAVIPLLTDLADIAAVAVRAISPFLPLIRDLGLAFLIYKSFTFIPGLLTAIGTALQLVGLQAAGSAVATKGIGLAMAGAVPELAAAAAVFVALAGAILSVTGVIDNFKDKLEGIISDALTPFQQATALVALSGISMEKALNLVNKAAKDSDGVVDLNDVMDNLRVHMDKAGNSVRNFAGLTNKHLKEFKSGVVESVQVSIGQFDSLKAAFGGTAQDLKKAADLAVRIARQEHRDLKAIFDDKSLTDGQKKAIASLSEAQRHQFAEGGSKLRQQIASDAVKLQRLNDQTFRQVTTSMGRTLRTGSIAAGKEVPAGVASGINSGSGVATAAANTLGNNVIQALRDSMAIESPSKKAIEIGHQLMEGLIIGMNQRFAKVSKTLDALIPLMQKALGAGAADQARGFLRSLDELDKRFGKLKDKVAGFRTGIRGAFSDFGDLIGGISAALEQFRSDQEQFLADQAAGVEGAVAPTAPNLQAIVADQVGQSALLASLLKQLQKAGLSTANLGDVADLGGTEAIATAQALLADPALIEQLNQAQQAIADITQSTADKMTNAAFGDKVAKMSEQLDRLLDKLKEFLAGLNVPELKEETREFINQLRRMNEVLQEVSGGGGGGGGAGNANAGGNSLRGPEVSVTVNVPNFVGSREELARVVRDEFVRIRRNGGTI